ncbi:MAG: DUF2508 family protein [Lachnospiraceae bacterium]|nr:DUF2508 family protein [Lachnospiraceae bacterium]MDD6505013.1 DUF2508 family protein [Lachnospiraceae bacterium]
MIFRKRTQKDTLDNGYVLLLDSLAKTSEELQSAYDTLENVTDPDLIDAYIYQAKAVQLRYKCLLESIKKMEGSYAKNPLL